MTEPMILRARVAAPLAAVHHALTDPSELRIWLAEKVEVDLPNRFEFWGRYTPDGDEPRQRLLHADDRTLRFDRLLDGVDTTVEIGLESESDDKTVIILSQSHFNIAEAMNGSSIRGALETYWCLTIANLVDHLEGRELTLRHNFTIVDPKADVDVDVEDHTSDGRGRQPTAGSRRRWPLTRAQNRAQAVQNTAGIGGQ